MTADLLAFLTSDDLRQIGATTKSGVTVVCVPPSIIDQILFPVRLSVELDVAFSKANWGISAPKGKGLISLWSCNDEERQSLTQAYASVFRHCKNKPRLICHGEEGFDYLGKEGHHALLRNIDHTVGLLTCLQAFDGPLTPVQIANLAKIRAKAKQMHCHLVILFVCEPGSGTNVDLGDSVDSVIHVEKCHPYDGYIAAFSIERKNRRWYSCLGSGKTMCSVALKDGKELKFQYDPYITAELRDRLMWHLYQTGETMDDIAARFGIHKSTVSRTLKELPDTTQNWLSSDEIERQVEKFLSKDEVGVSNPMETTTRESDDDGDFHLDDEPPKKKRKGEMLY